MNPSADRDQSSICPRIDPVDHQITWFLHHLLPCPAAHGKRQDVLDKVSSLLVKNLGRQIFPCGSFPLKTYLPHGDIDLVLFYESYRIHSDLELIRVASTLSEEAMFQDLRGYSQDNLPIRNVNFINARTKIVTCVVGSISVDITINQIGSLAAVLLVEEANLKFEKDLVKRSITLVKTWGTYEAPRYCGVGIAIYGAKNGGLPSYALNILVLRLFALYGELIKEPIDALLFFFREYSTFDWSHRCVTIFGSSSDCETSDNDEKPNIFSDVLTMLQSKLSTSASFLSDENHFQKRFCNIQDPLNKYNNLGYSVSFPVLRSMVLALQKGKEHLESLLMSRSSIFVSRLMGHRVCPVATSPAVDPLEQCPKMSPSVLVVSTKSADSSVVGSEALQSEDDMVKCHGKQSKSTLQRDVLLAVSSERPVLKPSVEEASQICANPSCFPLRRVGATHPNVVACDRTPWFLVAMFPHALRECCNGEGHRPDLREHPHQTWSPLQKLDTPESFDLDGTVQKMWEALNTSLEVLLSDHSRRCRWDSAASGLIDCDSSSNSNDYSHRRCSPMLSSDETNDSVISFNCNASEETLAKATKTPRTVMVDASIMCDLISSRYWKEGRPCEGNKKRGKEKSTSTEAVVSSSCGVQTDEQQSKADLLSISCSRRTHVQEQSTSSVLIPDRRATGKKQKRKVARGAATQTDKNFLNGYELVRARSSNEESSAASSCLYRRQFCAYVATLVGILAVLACTFIVFVTDEVIQLRAPENPNGLVSKEVALSYSIDSRAVECKVWCADYHEEKEVAILGGMVYGRVSHYSFEVFDWLIDAESSDAMEEFCPAVSSSG